MEMSSLGTTAGSENKINERGGQVKKGRTYFMHLEGNKRSKQNLFSLRPAIKKKTCP
jgi:hypothetical protein